MVVARSVDILIGNVFVLQYLELVENVATHILSVLATRKIFLPYINNSDIIMKRKFNMFENALLSFILSATTMVMVALAYKLIYGLSIIPTDGFTYFLVILYFAIFMGVLQLNSIYCIYKRKKDNQC